MRLWTSISPFWTAYPKKWTRRLRRLAKSLNSQPHGPLSGIRVIDWTMWQMYVPRIHHGVTRSDYRLTDRNVIKDDG